MFFIACIFYYIPYIWFVLYTHGTYERSLEKLVVAQDTSNIESTDEFREQSKKKRRLKAKKIIPDSSSSDELSGYSLEQNKENYGTQKTILPDFPNIKSFLLSKTQENTIVETPNVLSEKSFTSNIASISSSYKYISYVVFLNQI